MVKKKKGGNSVILTGAIIFISVSLVLGWTWHSFPGYKVDGGAAVVEKAFYDKQSDLMVEVTGEVIRVIDQAKNNPKHQEFQMRLPTGQLLLVVHRNDSNEWIPLAANDMVVVRGRYLWSEMGGIIRDTQRDSSMERMHGWVKHKGERYD